MVTHTSYHKCLKPLQVVEVTCTGVREGKLVDPVVRCIREKPIDEIDTIEQFEELEEVWGIRVQYELMVEKGFNECSALYDIILYVTHGCNHQLFTLFKLIY